MIGDGTLPDFKGVAPSASLFATASGDFDQLNVVDSANRTAIVSTSEVTAINMSFAIPLEDPETANGGSYLSSFLDWSARQHDVLYVAAWGNDTQEYERSPADILNGIVVGASMQVDGEGAWLKFSDGNASLGLFHGENETMRIDILAPGKEMHVIQKNNVTTDNGFGTSFAAPLVTGSVALLQEYADEHFSLSPPRFTSNSWKHQVKKAVMMNSADKLAGVHGSFRTAIDSSDMDWTQSEAFNNPSVPLDDQLGAGLLNVQRAVQQFAPGEYDPGMIPLIGWDYGTIPTANQSIEYVFDQPLGADEYIAITLAYDRNLFCSCGTSYLTGSVITPDFLPEITLSLQKLDGTVVASSSSSTLTLAHIFTDSIEAGQYKIVVSRGFDSAEETGFGLAWWYGAPPAVAGAGDFNSDGHVDAADYVMWRKNSGTSMEYDEWVENFGEMYGAGSSANVPEPAGAVTLLMAMCLVNVCRRAAKHRSLRVRSHRESTCYFPTASISR
jgi:hypothetical protein